MEKNVAKDLFKDRRGGKLAPDQIPSTPPTQADWDQVRKAKGRPLPQSFIEGVQERTRANMNRMVEREEQAVFRDRKGENPYGK